MVDWTFDTNKLNSYKNLENLELKESDFSKDVNKKLFAIFDALGEDADYYMGETSESPDLTDTSTENIKKNLTDMMFGTSVTIVILSPNMKQSKWIDWEIEYCLRKYKRKDRTSQRNGVVGVIMKVDGGYSWLKNTVTKDDGCTVTRYYSEKLFI